MPGVVYISGPSSPAGRRTRESQHASHRFACACTHSIDNEHLPADVLTRITGKEDDGSCEILRLSPPVRRDAFTDLA